MTSRPPISRVSKSPLVQHQQHAIPISTPRERHSEYDTKPPVGKHTPSRPSSAKIRIQVERCDELQKHLEINKQAILRLSEQVNEEYKQLCGDFGKKEDWHRIVGLSLMINNIQTQITELKQKLANYITENNRLRKTTNVLKTRLRQLEGRCMLIAKEQKSIKEQMKASPKNLTRRPKAQTVTMSPSSSQLRTTDPQLDTSVASLKAKKSDIQTQLSQYQSEIDNLIKTERILKEKINGLQNSHDAIKQATLMLKEKEKSSRSSRKHKQDLQKTSTKQVWQDNQVHTLWPSQSTNNLEAMTNEARAHQERELRRAQLEIQQKARSQELLKESGSLEIKIVDLQNQLHDANKRNEKLCQQLVETEEELRKKWISHINEKDKRITELGKSISDEAINRQKLRQQYEDQIKELKLKLRESSLQLAKAKEDIKLLQTAISAKHSDLERCHIRLQKGLQENNSELTKTKQSLREKDFELARTKESLKERELELTKTKQSLKEKELELATGLKEKTRTKESLKEKDIELTRTKGNLKEKDLELSRTKESLKEKDLELARTKESLKERELELTKTKQSSKEKDLELATIKENLKEKDLELAKTKENLKEKDLEITRTKENYASLQTAMEDLQGRLEKALQEKDLELAETKKRYQTVLAQNEGLRRRRERSISPLSKQDDQSYKNYENISKRLLIERLSKTEQELKKYEESLLKYEEKSFKYTNAFTSAGEGSVLEMSKRYRHLQHNKRAAAARALKKVHKIDVRDHLCDQIMIAYETARSVVLDKARECINNNLFELQTANDEHDKELLQGCMMILGCIQEDERIRNTAINQINSTLDKKLMGDKSLPSEVEDYYQSLAELTWCAVARPIPMIIAKSPDTYCKCYHELKDGEDVEDGSPVNYVYPVLYSSNEWPRQVAQEGRVVLKLQQHL